MQTAVEKRPLPASRSAGRMPGSHASAASAWRTAHSRLAWRSGEPPVRSVLPLHQLLRDGDAGRDADAARHQQDGRVALQLQRGGAVGPVQAHAEGGIPLMNAFLWSSPTYSPRPP
jgi:hypothetical protein